MSKIDLNKFKDVVGQLKSKQKHLQSLMNKETLKEAKKYAEASGQELKRLIKTTDAKKVKSFIEKEAKELQKLQKNLPQEIAKLTKFVESQKKEFEKILKSAHPVDLVKAKVGLGKKSKASSPVSGIKKKVKSEVVSSKKEGETSSPGTSSTLTEN